MVTCCSCIASSSAACTLAGARLISSARMMWAKSGPFLTWKSWRLLVEDHGADHVGGQQVGRELDAGERGVDDLGERAHGERLGQPGHALEQMWPPVSRPTSSRSTIASWPTIRRDTSLRMRCTGSVSAGLSVSFGALTLAGSWDAVAGKIAGRSDAACHPTAPSARRAVPVSPASGVMPDRPVQRRLLRAASAAGSGPAAGRPGAPDRRRAAPAGPP